MARREGANRRSKGRETAVERVRTPAVACDFCGCCAPGEDADVPLTWLVSVEGGVTRTYCEPCARRHLRSIEAKLDSQWW
jgi:hypothetical protein